MNTENTAQPATSSAKLALMEDNPPAKFSTFKKMRGSVLDRHDKVAVDGNQYLSFNGISLKIFEQVLNKRAELGRGVRVMYFPDIEVLIIKIPTKPHEKSHLILGSMIDRAVYSMGIGLDEFSPLGATIYKGDNESRKEEDSSYINEVRRLLSDDWPCFVIQAGASESLPRLRSDASWWGVRDNLGLVPTSRPKDHYIWLLASQTSLGTLYSSALLGSLTTNSKRIQIEKYIPGLPTTRVSQRRATTVRPNLISTITIDASKAPTIVTGAPLRLEFSRIFDRPANPPIESDIVFNDVDLDNWAKAVLAGI